MSAAGQQAQVGCPKIDVTRDHKPFHYFADSSVDRITDKLHKPIQETEKTTVYQMTHIEADLLPAEIRKISLTLIIALGFIGWPLSSD